MKIGQYKLHNNEKINRAISGVDFVTKNGTEHSGGIPLDEEGKYKKADLLAEYDKLGGYITKDGNSIKKGSFYDFKGKKPLDKPEITFTYNVNGEFIDVKEGEKTPGIVEAVKIVEKRKVERATKKK